MIFAVLLLPALLIAIRAEYVDDFLYHYSGVRYLGALRVIINDAPIHVLIMACLYASFLTKTPLILSVFLRSLALFLIAVYALDIFVLVNFANHLTLTDIFKYASYSLKYVQQTQSRNIFIFFILFIFSSLFAVFFIFLNYKIRNKYRHTIFGVSTFLLLLISSLTFVIENKYIHSWIYKNVISHNLIVMSESKEYSREFLQNFYFNEKYTCSTDVMENPNNIIVLMVESLSNYQSHFFSGIKNWTPNLDEIAKNNIAFKTFYANGFTTEDGEISLLTGELPIYKPASYSNGGGSSFNGFFNVENSLPNILKMYRYKTEFLTTADLDFSNTGEWAKSIGFDYVEGHENKYYENFARLHFEAAPDKALYDRTIERIKNNDESRHFYFIKTASSHHPFINPETYTKSEEDVFRYADKQLGIFYKHLKKIDFFNDGILIIVGDHRAMVPLNNEEIQKYGASRASAKVPLIVSHGGKIKQSDNSQYQQIDIYNSLVGMVVDSQYFSNWKGDVINMKPAKYIAHRRGDNRNVVTVISGEATAEIKLDGDDTRVLSQHPEGAFSLHDKDEIVNKINSTRILKANAGASKTNQEKRLNLSSAPSGTTTQGCQ